MSQKRQLDDGAQLLTPHASSSTQCIYSSPSKAYERVLPSRQYARPKLSGEWFTLGRSSAENDLALPSNNRLVSRIHCKLRYLEPEHAFELKCMGFNGVSLRISDQTIFVKRKTGILIQLHEDCELELDVAGSLVEIETPKDEAATTDSEVLFPSSPVMQALEIPDLNEKLALEHDLQAVNIIQPLSPLHSATGMMTPSMTPSAKRIRLDTPEPFLDRSSDARRQPLDFPEKTLQPRLLKFNDDENLRIPNQALPCVTTEQLHKGKENLPPIFAIAARQEAADKCLPAVQMSLDTTPEQSTSVRADCEPVEVHSNLEAMTAESASPEPVTHIETIVGTENEEAFDPEDIDQEFVDMLLTILATSAINPAPLSVLTPFFPAGTSTATITTILRTQACITEHVIKDECSATSQESSTWSYDPTKDSDTLRMSRLSNLQKPQRSLRPRTYQQLHTYAYEHSKYVMDCKAAGIKPVRFDGTRYRRTHASQTPDN